MRPRIGVTMNAKSGARPLNDGRLLTLSPDFVTAISAAGGLPIPLPPRAPEGALDHPALDAMLDQIDGLVLTGGDDIDPAAYGQRPHEKCVRLDRERDVSDQALVTAALERELPVLGVCAGMQLLNVALGGTLHQHLADLRGGVYPDLHAIHDAQETKSTEHGVRVDSGSRVATLLGDAPLITNSRHHQAVDRLGDGLRVVATAEDGVVEAIETTNTTGATASRFLIGVQWHPEEHRGEARHIELFAGLVRAAFDRTAAAADRSTVRVEAPERTTRT